MIFDIDAHFEPGNDWLDPYARCARSCRTFIPPSPPSKGSPAISCGRCPRSIAPPWKSCSRRAWPCSSVSEKADEAARRAEFEGKNQREVADAAARVQWLDAQGIDDQNVICLAGYGFELAIGDRDLP